MSVLSTGPAGPPAAAVRGKKGGVGRTSSQAAEAVSDFGAAVAAKSSSAAGRARCRC
jgi:hypothetical protein